MAHRRNSLASPAQVEQLCSAQHKQLQALRTTLHAARDQLAEAAHTLASLEAQHRDLTAACFALVHKQPEGTQAQAAAAPSSTEAAKPEPQGETLVLHGARGANARAVRSAEGVLVLKGSEVAPTTVPSMPESQRALRRKLVKDGVIAKDRKNWRFVKDHLFPNASLAASVVMGRAANGRKEWKSESGAASAADAQD